MAVSRILKDSDFSLRKGRFFLTFTVFQKIKHVVTFLTLKVFKKDKIIIYVCFEAD